MKPTPKPRQKREVTTKFQFRNWKRRQDRLHAKALASKPECPICGEVIDNPKDICVNNTMGPCHLTCILIEWCLGTAEQEERKP